MPLPINIDDLLHGKSVEWERLELKTGWNPLETLHTICAFANDFHNWGGGYVVVGVAERDGLPILPPQGLNAGQLDSIQKELLRLGQNAIQPAYNPVAAPYMIGGRLILVIWAPGGQTRPYKAKLSLAKGDREYGYFIRKGSSTVRAKGSDETELLSLAATVPFDDRLNQQARAEDLSRELMQDYLTRVGSDLSDLAPSLSLEQLGRQLGVVGGVGEAPFPVNAGLVMFSPEPQRFFPVMQIDVVWFPKEGPGGDQFSEKVFRGPLPRMLGESLDYIRRNFISETVIKHRDRAESTRVENFPYAAVEEAVVNAVYHRAYDVREPVEVRILHDELVVLSYPGPDRSVRLEQLRAGRAHSRRYRNRRLGEFLKELEFTEGRSTGIPKILHAMEANGSPPPEFEFDEDHTYFQVRLPVHPAAKEKNDAPSDADLPGLDLEFGTKSALSRHQVDILASCEQLRAASELMHLTGRSDRTKFKTSLLLPLLVNGLVEMTVPDKPKSRLQRYRITPLGRQVLERYRQEGSL